MPKSKIDAFQLIPHHCGISVPDLDASIAWYRDMLGFSVEKRLTYIWLLTAVRLWYRRFLR